MKKIRGVIFDLDGTVGDTLPLCIRAFKKAVEPLINRTVTEAEIVATFGPSEEGTIMALAPDHYEKGVADYLLNYESLHHMCPAPFDGMTGILEFLTSNNVRLAMVTGKGKISTEISLSQFEIAHFFEMVETGHPSGPRKPFGIRNVMNFFSEIAKDEIIYVGDATSDIIGCREVGIRIASAAWAATAERNDLLALEPDAIFYNIPDFASWLSARI